VNTVMNKNTISSSSTHFFDLDGAKPQFSSATGSRTIDDLVKSIWDD
jgi:hypothetical protein